MTDRGAVGPTAGDVARHRLAAQHAVAGRAAHEVKNALNAVSVNLAVVQSRLRRQQAPESVTRFVDTAVAQLELLTAQVEALLALARDVPPPADVAAVARQLATLLGRGDGEGASVVVTLPDSGAACTAADPGVVQAVLGQLLAAAAGMPGGGECSIATGPAGSVRLALRTAAPLALGDDIAELARAAGVIVEGGADGPLAVTFPPAPEGAGP